MPDPLVCGACGATDSPARIRGMWVDPPGWTQLTLSGTPGTGRLLCPPCATEIRLRLVELANPQEATPPS